MINVIIVEDDIISQTILQHKIKKFYPQCAVAAIVDNKNEAVELLKKNPPDLLFLDVEIIGGSGLDVLKSLESFSFEVIFVTASKEYAIEALNLGGSYYFLKPIEQHEFQKGMDLVLEKINEKRIKKFIFLQHNNTEVTVKTEDILYLMADGSYTKIITKKQEYISSKNLGQYEDMLSSLGFLRTHHSYIVNTGKIKDLKKGRTGEIILLDDLSVPISQRRMKEVVEKLELS